MNRLPFTSDTAVFRTIRAAQAGEIVYACGVRVPLVAKVQP